MAKKKIWLFEKWFQIPLPTCRILRGIYDGAAGKPEDHFPSLSICGKSTIVLLTTWLANAVTCTPRITDCGEKKGWGRQTGEGGKSVVTPGPLTENISYGLTIRQVNTLAQKGWLYKRFAVQEGGHASKSRMRFCGGKAASISIFHWASCLRDTLSFSY